MSTINQIQLPNGSTYDFEDTAAREEASSKADKTLATTSSAGLMSKEDKTKLDSLSDSGIHYVPFKLVDDYTCSTTDSFDTVMSMVQANKPVQALVNMDGKTISLPVFMYDAGSEEIMFRNDEMYIIWASTAEMIGDIILAIYGPTITDKLQDNDTTETSGQAALDAHMGKVLSDRINAVKTGAIDQIVKNTAQIETAGTATNAHSVGEYVMISNALYKVAASVAKGDTWTIGTNVTAANIGGEISALNSSLATKTGSLIPNAIALNNYNWVSVKQTGNVVNVQFRLQNNGYVFATEQFNPCTVTGVDLPSDSNIFIIGNAYSSRSPFLCEHSCYAVIGNDGKIYIKVPTANELWVFVSFTYIV